MNYLSPKKQHFVNFIRDFTHDNNRPPTFVEIMSGLDIRSLGTVNWYVNELEKEDVIRRMKGKNGKRALSVLDQNIHNRGAHKSDARCRWGLPRGRCIARREIVPHWRRSELQPSVFQLRVDADANAFR